MDAVMGAVQTEEMAGAMEYDGVLPETVVILVGGIAFRRSSGALATDLPGDELWTSAPTTRHTIGSWQSTWKLRSRSTALVGS